MNAFVHRRRKGVVWFFIAATLLLGVGAQLHGLWHSLQAVQAPAHKDALAAHPQACEQCVLYATLDCAAPARLATPAPLLSAAPEWSAPAARLRGSAFTAYVSRAPPAPA